MNEDPDERYSLLPVEECAVHPSAKIRFEYQVDELAESMAAIGQVQPGKALQVPEDGSGARFLVYIGCRRLLACKKAGVQHFKALIVKTADENRILTELLTENMKRANLSVLEELSLLAKHSRQLKSLEMLARDIGLSPKFMREKVKTAMLLQEKGLIETLYRVEQVSGFKFTLRHIEKITGLEQDKWLPAAIHAAERSWKAEDIETLGTRFTLESLIQTLPVWGRQFVPSTTNQPNVGSRVITTGREPGSVSGVNHATPAGLVKRSESVETDYSSVESHSRYQTLAESAQFLICPRCGSETPVEFPPYPPATLLKPGKVVKNEGIISLDKESVPLLVAAASIKCTNEKCGRMMVAVLDQSSDGQVLAGRSRLLSLIGSGQEPENGGIAALVWDGEQEVWLKAQSGQKGEQTTYLAYDEQARRWVIPVRLGEHSSKVTA